MSRSFKKAPFQSYSGPGKTFYKTYLNRRLRRQKWFDLPSYGAYRRVRYDYECLHGWGGGGQPLFSQCAWDRHVEECLETFDSQPWWLRGEWTLTDALRSIRRPLVK